MKKIFLAVLLLLTPLSSQALFEFRAGYGNNTLDEDSYTAGSGVLADLDKGAGFNIDFLFEPPLITDLGIGLRYEVMKYDFTLNIGGNGEAEMKRLALLVDYKFIDFFAYFGVIGSFDITNDVKTTSPNSVTTDDPKFMWSAGLEAGVNLGLLSLGAEVGKFFGTVERTGNNDLELDGLYGKVLVGFGF